MSPPLAAALSFVIVKPPVAVADIPWFTDRQTGSPTAIMATIATVVFATRMMPSRRTVPPAESPGLWPHSVSTSESWSPDGSATVAAKSTTPIAPNHCMMLRHHCSQGSASDESSSIGNPVVDTPDTASKTADVGSSSCSASPEAVATWTAIQVMSPNASATSIQHAASSARIVGPRKHPVCEKGDRTEDHGGGCEGDSSAVLSVRDGDGDDRRSGSRRGCQSDQQGPEHGVTGSAFRAPVLERVPCLLRHRDLQDSAQHTHQGLQSSLFRLWYPPPGI